MRRESLHSLNAHIILEGFQKRKRHPCQQKITLKGVLHDLFLQNSSFSLKLLKMMHSCFIFTYLF
jgi:hypothetical protein